MSKRLTQYVVLATLVGPLLHLACGSAEDRKFVDPGTGGSAGSAVGGSAGTTGGSGGAPDGGNACAADAECDDGNSCNGVETCANSLCQPGSNVGNGTSCTPNFGDAGTPDAGMGEYICAEGQCLVKCSADSECEDNDACTGKEICNPTTNTCLSGSPPACEDNDACTDNSCDPLTGCIYPTIDADGDGHASTALGSCGDDCDDTNPAVYAGAAEICDSVDNNCNGSATEAFPYWYQDCDEDTFAPTGGLTLQQCDKPTNVPQPCGTTGSWTSQAPAAGTTDCVDQNAKAHPYTAANNSLAFQGVAMSGVSAALDFDYNCDAVEEKEFTVSFVSTSANCTKGSIIIGGGIASGGGGNGGAPSFYGDQPSAVGGVGNIGGIGGITGFTCVGSDGWTSSSPACGATATWSDCHASGSNCVRVSSQKQQRCR